MKKSRITINDFKMESVLFTAGGCWVNAHQYYNGTSEEDKFEINYSSILSFLIQRAGGICKHYSSDLFITWCYIYDKLKDLHYKGDKILFGFREMGVDSNAFVLSRCNNYEINGMYNEIKELYVLDIKVDEEFYMTMELGKAVLK